MGFISMVFASVFLVLLLVGLFGGAIGLILDIIWIVRKKGKKKVPIALRVFAVLFSLIGFALFIFPIGALVFMSYAGKYEQEAKLSQFEKQIMISDSDSIFDGFEVDDIKYIPVDFLHPGNDEDGLEPFCAFVNENDSYKLCYKRPSAGGFDLLTFEHSSKVYVKETEYDTIFNYYENEAPLDVKISIYGISDDEDTEAKLPDFDRETLCHINSYYDADMDFECDGDQIEYSMYLIGYSEDKLFYKDASLSVVEGQVVLSHISGGNHMRGHILPQEDVQYLLEQIEEYVD